MLPPVDIDITLFKGKRMLHHFLETNHITMAGNRNLKIYGSLKCRSGKRMLSKNRVFFANEQDAVDNGYRPCGHCLPESYKTWKNKNDSVT